VGATGDAPASALEDGMDEKSGAGASPPSGAGPGSAWALEVVVALV
jgi:hypothetical protein